MKSLRRHSARASSQRGGALLILAVILVLGSMWALVSALNVARNDTAATQTSNAAVLRQAKSALLGYVAIQAGTDAFPGRLPCPEDPSISTAAPFAGDGTAAAYCTTLTTPAIGRLPWRTLGIDKLTDSTGEPLWYVLSPGFNRANSGVALKINSNTPAQLTLDSTAAVALIIAPGNALNVQAAAGCIARNQLRVQTAPLNYLDYLECDNATSPADNSFVSTGPSGSFNDQVLAVTHADVFNIVEPAVATRIGTDVVPSLKTAYDSADWSASAAATLFPFAAPFPSLSPTGCQTLPISTPCTPDTHYYAGAAGTRQGLLPLTYSKKPSSTVNCVVSGADPRCNPSLIAWKTGGGSLVFAASLPIPNNPRYSMYSAPPQATMTVPSGYISITEVANTETTRSTLAKLDCSATTSTQLSCAVTYGRACSSYPSACGTAFTVQPRVRLTARALNVAETFKMFDASQIVAGAFKTGATVLNAAFPSPLGVLRSDGDADITTEWLLPSASCKISLCTTYTISIPIALITDHAILSSADGVTGWFISNEWYKLTYYAVSSANTPGGSGTCDGTHPCLTVKSPSGNTSPKAILILAGRNIGAGLRPTGNLTDYLEGENASPVDLIFDNKPLSPTFNDHVIKLYP